MIDRELLKGAAAEFSVEVDDRLAERLDVYAALLVEWNQKMNLTAITEPTDLVIKHFVDSLSAAKMLPDGEFSLIDVGTGAGFPGVPLALYREDCHLTLLDSLQKRLTFLETLCRELGLPVTCIHARAEEGGRRAELREQFDVATARAVASLPVLCEYCLPYVKKGGRFIALKGPDAENEVKSAQNALSLLGGRVKEVCPLILPPDAAGERGQRRLVVIDKCAPTPAKFPRPTAKMAKNPL
ncbi:MAG: 16S rRNA (guanine(527)-N(7))-methyltransferase RsmG [Clostridia bacterium]|nr:16S rRNA (guanine(527)-N(7))-methyltransferase RsmG [Clostridia bacterium]